MSRAAKNSFIYFAPGPYNAATPKLVSDLGLTRSLGGMLLGHSRCIQGGPEGLTGVTFYGHEPGTESDNTVPRISLDAQVWHRCAGGKYFVGYWKDRKPGPADLERSPLTPGTKVLMRDGNKWLVPAIQPKEFYGDGWRAKPSPLPIGIALDADGEIIPEIIEEYTVFSDAAETAWRFHVDPNFEGITHSDMIRIVETCLSLNYRVGCGECSALRLFTTANIYDALSAIVDFGVLRAVKDAIDEADKKKDLANTTDGSDIECGAIGSPPDTEPHTQISNSTSGGSDA